MKRAEAKLENQLISACVKQINKEISKKFESNMCCTLALRKEQPQHTNWMAR